MEYEAYRYAADGHAGEEGDERVICVGTLLECREAIKSELGYTIRIPRSLRWSGFGEDVEAYHDSKNVGCGGFAIRKVEG